MNYMLAIFNYQIIIKNSKMAKNLQCSTWISHSTAGPEKGIGD